MHITSILTSVALLLALPTKTAVSFSPGVANRAIHILEEASSQNIPVDAALRRYAKYQERSYVKSEEYKSISDILRNISISQYRIDWQLREAGVECSPENRVAFLKKGGPLECRGMDLQTTLECPDWAWTGLKEAFPDEEDLSKELRALMQPAPLDLRVNTLKCEERIDALREIINAGYDATSTPWSPIGIRLEERTALGRIPGLLDGIVEPQDEGSQLVASLLEAQPGETVADYCAGSGGKTLQIAASMKNKGRLYSMDVSEDRLERGKPRCKKAGVSNVQRQVVQEDMTRKDKWLKRRKGTFDRVLVDAPCSGVGSWRRKPDARRTWATFDDGFDGGIDRLANLLPLQQQILQRASRLVKVGGRLVYVTCSLLPQENEKQIIQFLESDVGAEWKVESPPSDFAIPFEVVDGQFLRLTPAQHNTDGFFAAVLTKHG